MDDFKQYNDTNGTLAGDQLLQKVSSILNIKTRQGVDSCYRYDGDEFAIILIETELGITQAIQNRIETSIWDECNMGISIAHTQFSRGLSPEAFLKKAVDRLNLAKAGKTAKKR